MHRRWSLVWAAVDGAIVVLWYVSVALLAVAAVLLCWFIGWKIITVALMPEPTAPGGEVMACAVSDGRFSVQEVSCADPTAGWQILGTVPEVTLAGYEAGWRTVCAAWPSTTAAVWDGRSRDRPAPVVCLRART